MFYLSRIRIKTRVFLRLGLFLILAALFLSGEGVLLLLPQTEKKRIRLRLRWSQWLIRFYTRWIGLKIRWLGQVASDRTLPEVFLGISNHLSYVDVLVLVSRIQTRFVTSVEVRDTPFLGALCKAAGCVFVERRNRDSIGVEIAEMTQALRDGFSVFFFPESTSSNGAGVLPFKRSLFRAVQHGVAPVIPFCINYHKIDGELVTSQNRDQIFYYGDHDFFTQLLRLLACRTVEVEVTACDPIGIPEQTDFHRVLSEKSYQEICAQYQNIV